MAGELKAANWKPTANTNSATNVPGMNTNIVITDLDDIDIILQL